MTALLVVCCIIAIVLLRFQSNVAHGYKAVERKAAPIRTWILPVPSLYKEILSKYFPYYVALAESNRKKFEKKVCNFIYSKIFIPRQMSEVSVEARVLIAASAVQLTFGLPEIYLQHFDKILVYPNEYYSSITKKFHKGEVNPRFGIIVLSWRNFVEGYASPEDAVNLGLHEMAHALRLENVIRNDEYGFFDANLIRAFDAYAARVCEKPDSFGNFFRRYACTDPHEFFSVAIENFFERPATFVKTIPELYRIITRLLLQDPLKLMQVGNAS